MSFYHLIECKFADPISSIAINDKYVISGSIMGRLIFTNLLEKKDIILSEFNIENIAGIQIETEDTFNVAIGDDEVLRYKINNYGSQISFENYHQKNYEDELLHKTKCEGCYTILSKFHLIMVHLPISDGNKKESINVNISVKNIHNYTTENFFLEMSNYSVPFDFDGKLFIWIEFDYENLRNICVYNNETKTTTKHVINKEFGHVSFCKLLNSHKIFLVRLQNIVEIRNIHDFKLVKTFVNLGEEIIAIDFFYNNSKIILNEGIDNLIYMSNCVNNNNNNLVLNSNAKHPTFNEMQSSKFQDEKPICLKKEIAILQINDEANLSEENLSIVLLDIDGNVNLWENCIISTKFNLYNTQELNEEYKSKQFFSMGYGYHIKANSNYYIVSSDHGVIIFKKEN